MRTQISELDRALLELVERRLRLVAVLWEIKQAHGLELVDPNQEAALRLRTYVRARELGLDPEFCWRVLRQIVEEGKVRALEQLRPVPPADRPPAPVRRSDASPDAPGLRSG